MDIPAVCEELQYKYEEIPIITFQKGGFREKLHHGVEEALLQIVKHIPKDCEKSKTPTFNIIGSCIDFARFEADVEEIKRILRGAFHMEPCCILTSNTTISQIEQMGQAHINLVIRREGTKAAKLLQQKFDTPYLIGRPYGLEGTKEWLDGISKCLNLEMDEQFIKDEIAESKHQYSYFKQLLPYLNHKGKFSIGTHIDIAEGISRFAKDLGMSGEHIWCNEKAYATETIPYFTEEQWMNIVSSESNTILMGSKMLIEQFNGNQNYILTRGLNSWNFNPYVSPFVGFRGARNLCDLWMQDS
jgi:nitrogenase molybdenum-iron protein alpha/beta subunit